MARRQAEYPEQSTDRSSPAGARNKYNFEREKLAIWEKLPENHGTATLLGGAWKPLPSGEHPSSRLRVNTLAHVSP